MSLAAAVYLFLCCCIYKPEFLQGPSFYFKMKKQGNDPVIRGFIHTEGLGNHTVDERRLTKGVASSLIPRLSLKHRNAMGALHTGRPVHAP